MAERSSRRASATRAAGELAAIDGARVDHLSMIGAVTGRYLFGVCLATLALVSPGAPSLMAQEAAPPPAANVAEPAPEQLPEVEVLQATPAAPARKKTATKPKPQPVTVSAAPAPTPPQPVGTDETANSRGADRPPGSPGSATGPVDGYVASRTATATKTDTPIVEVPQSITVVPKDRIRDEGATTVEQATRYIPGVFAEPYGFDSRGDYTIVRGSTPSQFQDGLKRRFTFYDYGKAEPYTLERLELLKGPASMLYGAHSTSGILNYISKRPQEEEHREIGFEYGSFERMQVKTDMTGKLTDDGRWLYRFVGVGREADTQMDFADNNRFVFAPSITFRPQNGTSFTLLGQYQEDQASASTLGFFPIEGTLNRTANGRVSTRTNPSNPDFDSYDTQAGTVTALFDHKINSIWSVHQNAKYIDLSVRQEGAYADIYSNPGNPFLDPARRTVARFIYTGKTVGEAILSDTNAVADFDAGWSQHKLLVGFDYIRYHQQSSDFGAGTTLDSRPFDIYTPNYMSTVNAPIISLLPSSAQSQRGGYIQDQITVGSWVATLGVRHDDLSASTYGVATEQENSAFTQRYALLYKTAVNFNPYISYAESFDPVLGADINGKFFTPLRGELHEAGFKYQPAAAVLISGAIFELTENNRLTSDPTNPFNSVQLGEVEVTGAEIEVIASVSANIDIVTGYSYTDAEITKGDGRGNVVEGVPEHLASLWAVYRFDAGIMKGISVGGGVRYVGSSGQDYYESPSFTLFDAMVSYDTKDWRFQLNGSNLEDEVHVTTCGARGDCFYGQRRAFLSSFTYKF